MEIEKDAESQFIAADSNYMQQALALAKQADSEGEIPVGAVVVLDDAIVGKGHNRSIRSNDPTWHAEVAAIREAAKFVGNYRLSGACLYVTLEPCTMCLGAMVHARISRLVYGAVDSKSGALGGVIDLRQLKLFNHRIESSYGLFGTESANLMKEFFKKKRK